MKLLLPLVLFFTMSCAPSKDEIVDECQTIVDEAIVESWEECQSFYEETVIPQLVLLINDLKDYIAQECN